MVIIMYSPPFAKEMKMRYGFSQCLHPSFKTVHILYHWVFLKVIILELLEGDFVDMKVRLNMYALINRFGSGQVGCLCYETGNRTDPFRF